VGVRGFEKDVTEEALARDARHYAAATTVTGLGKKKKGVDWTDDGENSGKKGREMISETELG